VRARYQQPPAAVCKQRVLTVGQLIIHLHEARVGAMLPPSAVLGAERGRRGESLLVERMARLPPPIVPQF
jgi:hypothetical protein